jgi:hypothetical protein
VAAGADHQQVAALLLRLLVKSAPRAHRHDADEFRRYLRGGALLLKQCVRGVALLSNQAGGDGVRRAQIAAVHVSECQFSIRVSEL